MSSASTSSTVVPSLVATALEELEPLDEDELVVVSLATEAPQPARSSVARVPATAWRIGGSRTVAALS
jgi:hypothetical protein